MGKTSGDAKYFDYFGQVNNDQREGLGRQCVHFDRLIEGFFKNGMINGFARIIYQDGAYYEGTFKDAKKHGFGRHNFSNGEKYEGTFREGIQVGKGKLHLGDGTVRDTEWSVVNE